MVKTLLTFSFLLLLVAPAMAQDDYPRVEMGFGYANFSIPTTSANKVDHYSGFGMHTNYNFTPMLGLDNYTGYYSLGSGSTLFANIFALKATKRFEKVAPYVVAGIGGASSSVQSGGYYYSGGSSLASRLGGGVDYKLSDVIGLRFDVSKMQLNSNGWIGKANFSTGVIFTIMQ